MCRVIPEKNYPFPERRYKRPCKGKIYLTRFEFKPDYVFKIFLKLLVEALYFSYIYQRILSMKVYGVEVDREDKSKHLFFYQVATTENTYIGFCDDYRLKGDTTKENFDYLFRFFRGNL